MKTRSVRIPEHIYLAIEHVAEDERRSVTNMTEVLLTLAIAGNLKIERPEPWPGERSASGEGQTDTAPEAEDEEPVTTVLPADESVWVAPAPMLRADEVTPDWKGKK